MTDREAMRNDPDRAAAEVKRLLDGRSQPFWTTTAGGGERPYIKIECEDLTLVHALDDFLIACVKSHWI